MRLAIDPSITALLTALALSGAAASADMLGSDDNAPWEACTLCHGTDGISTMAKFPKLAGQKQAYLRQQLENFRNETRTNDRGQMTATAQAVEAADMAVVTAYFAALPPPTPIPARDGESGSQAQRLTSGKQLYRTGNKNIAPCAACHSDPRSPAPWLHSQHYDYLVKQLQDFKCSARDSNDSMMRDTALALSENQLQAIALYLSRTARPRQTHLQKR